MRVRGEQPLPGATENLLRARKIVEERKQDAQQIDYLGVTVSVSVNGRWRVHAVRLDGPSRRVLTELLDTGTNWSSLGCSKASLIANWAEALDMGRRAG